MLANFEEDAPLVSQQCTALKACLKIPNFDMYSQGTDWRKRLNVLWMCSCKWKGSSETSGVSQREKNWDDGRKIRLSCVLKLTYISWYMSETSLNFYVTFNQSTEFGVRIMAQSFLACRGINLRGFVSCSSCLKLCLSINRLWVTLYLLRVLQLIRWGFYRFRSSHAIFLGLPT